MLLSQISQFFRHLPAGRRALALVWGAARCFYDDTIYPSEAQSVCYPEVV
jgi:hypothetical protein